MRLIGKDKILKHQKKNMGNLSLYNEINALIHQLENFNPATQRIHDVRPDADCVHADGFYFFDIQTHRTFVMLEFDEAGEATIIWVGSCWIFNGFCLVTNISCVHESPWSFNFRIQHFSGWIHHGMHIFA